MSEPGSRHSTPRWRIAIEGQAGYWTGLTTVALAILIRWLLDPILGHRVAFVTLFLALVPLAFVLRLRAFACATVAGVIGVHVLVVEPQGVLTEFQLADALSAVLVLFVASGLGVLAWQSRRREQLAITSARAARTMEAALRESEQRVQAIIDASLDAVVTMSERGTITGWNPQAQAVFGWTREEALHRVLGDLVIPEEHREAHRKGLAHFLKTGDGPVLNKRLELTALHKQGRIFPIELTISSLELDEHFEFSAFVRDLTKRKRAEEAVKQAEAKLRFVLDSMPQKILTAKPNGDVDYFNPQWTEFTGLTFETIRDWGWTQFIHTQDVEENIRRWQHSIDTGEPFLFEHRFRRADGEYRWHISRALPRRDGEGRIVMWIGSNTDIDDHKRAGEALRESQERLSIATGAAGLGIYEWDVRTDRAIWENERMYEIFGRSPQDGTHNKAEFVEHVLHREDLDRFERQLAEALAHRGDFHSINRIYRMDGALRWIETHARLEKAKDGLPLRQIGVVADITERKLWQDKVEELNETLEQKVTQRTAQLQAVNHELEAFSYSVSHDLRSPLRAIDGFSRDLLKDYADKLGARGASDLRRVRAASQRMGRLIDDLLNLSRLTRSEVQPTTFDLSAMARNIAEECQAEQPDRQAQFFIADGMIVEADAALIRIMLTNLIANAWKFTGKRRRARIELGRVADGGQPAYFVRDNGCGFDMAYAGKLFGAFQRLHGRVDFEGTGIGLAIVQRVINRHGGRVWAQAAVDQGATFYFTLAAAPAGEQGAAQADNDRGALARDHSDRPAA